MKRLQKVDELSLPNHFYISNDDECYFIMSYTSGKDYRYSQENNLISNLKKDMDKKDKPEWKYKQQAIEECAKYIKEVNISGAFSNDITIVPVPPSKAKGDPCYDDRLFQILHQAFGESIDIRDLILQKESTPSAHSSKEKRDPEKIAANYKINEKCTKGVKKSIIIFDDILTTGAHFKATKSVLSERFPDKEIKGLFIARRVYEQSNESDTTEILKLSKKW